MTCTQMYIITLFVIDKNWGQPKCLSTDEWINREWYIRTRDYYSAVKRNELLVHATTWPNFFKNYVEWKKDVHIISYHVLCKILGCANTFPDIKQMVG